ncbi:MAG: pyruvate kinase, partial [Atopobiaceae bacterium]|nr:pyruvate kinase [Atopobiaceae bacterium]
MFTGKRTKIVCTMGPACEDESTLRDLIRYGMNVARFNFSHGTHEYHKMVIERVRKVAAELGANVAIMLDTKGPEIRTGVLENHMRINLKTGDEIIVTTENVPGTKDRISIDYPNLPNELKRGNVILIDDGLIELVVRSVEMNNVHCRVTAGGLLGEHKGVTIPNVHLDIPSVTEQDRKDSLFGIEMGIDAISASFIRDADGVREIREILNANGGKGISIFSKIESSIAVKNFDEILAASQGIMVARGDLGVEVPPAEVPHLQKMMIRKCNAVYKPVITATQMLDSMIHNRIPTRAECT